MKLCVIEELGHRDAIFKKTGLEISVMYREKVWQFGFLLK